MIKIEKKVNCCGCNSCFNICPKNAIDMLEDEYGFKYPKINKEKCIDCDMCKKVCPIINKNEIENEPKAYACINKDEETRLKSSSGGIFTLLAETILDLKGVAFGAQFDSDFNVIHSYTENKEEIYKFRGSKYLQSNIGDSFKQVKKFLDEGRYVLFTGTPCQVEGLYSFLKKDYEKLYTQDIICHGVPSPKVWKKYKEELEKYKKSKIVEINFRDKSTGWSTYSLKYMFNNKKLYIEKNVNSKYMKAFLNDISLRDSCYECKFKTENRNSDITLADFWGIQNVIPEMHDNKGTSLLILNSKKGKKIFEIIKAKIEFEEVNIEEAIKYNPSMVKSATKPKKRASFFKDLEKLDFNELEKKYFPNPNLIVKLIRKIKTIIAMMIRRIKDIIK